MEATQAQEGIRELRNPEEMAKVAPVRAIGIRLTPAAPLNPQESDTPSAPTKVSLRGNASVTASLSGDEATSLPTAPTIQAQTVSVAVDRPPERIAPKSWTVSKASVVASETLELPALEGSQGREPILVTPQAPIRLSFSNEEISTTEAPSAPKPSMPSAMPTSLPMPAPLPMPSQLMMPAPMALPTGMTPSIDRAPSVAPAERVMVETEARVEDSIPATPAPPLPFELTLPAPIPVAAPKPVALPDPIPMALAPAIPPLLNAVPTADALTTPRTTSPVDTAPTETTSESSQRIDADSSNTDTSNVETSNVDTSVATDEATLHDAPPPPKRTMQLAPPTTAPVRMYSEQELAQALSVEMESQSAREIQVDVAIQGITVSDESVCRALASDGRVFLVGGQLGETVVEVKPVDGSPSRLLKVKVIAPWQSSHGVADLDQLLHAIRPLSPNGNLTIRAQNDGSLLVQGKVDNQDTARRVMELTRKLILVPVVDKLEIR
jgi:hypothetical protein